MKRWLSTFMAAFMVMALAGLANATNYDYYAQVYKRTITNAGDVVLTEVSSGVTFKVLTINTNS